MSIFTPNLPVAQPLPVSAYHDADVFEREKTLFAKAPQFVGHASYVPNPGDYYALPQEGEGRALIRQSDGSIALLSNICRHRQAIMLRGQGSLPLHGQIVCPLHHWAYDAQGRQTAAPQFAQNPCRHLPRTLLHEWNGLLFTGPRNPAQDFATLASAHAFDFSNYALGHVEQHHCAYNWKTFMEVYLEDYHVASSHPGLGRFVDCGDLQWQFDANFSVQTVGLSPQFNSPGSAAYLAWHQAVQAREAALPQHGAIWLSYYPSVMIEWYPNVLTVSTLTPIGPQSTQNTVAFFYPQDILDFEPEYCAAQRSAYMETCLEDDDFALRMDAGRKALWLSGRNDAGPYQSPLEDGMAHFHAWYHGQMK